MEPWTCQDSMESVLDSPCNQRYIRNIDQKEWGRLVMYLFCGTEQSFGLPVVHQQSFTSTSLEFGLKFSSLTFHTPSCSARFSCHASDHLLWLSMRPANPYCIFNKPAPCVVHFCPYQENESTGCNF